MFFNSKGKLPHYSLHGHELEIVEEVKYLEVIFQSDIKFTAHIHRKFMTANQQPGIIKGALYWAPTNANLLTYKTFCFPGLEYAAAAWDPTRRKDTSDIEPLPDQAAQFIAGIKGRCRRCQD